MKIIDEFMAEAIYPVPRSDEYKAGIRAALEFIIIHGEELSPPYPIGTAQSDAWFAGLEEGHRIAAELQEDEA